MNKENNEAIALKIQSLKEEITLLEELYERYNESNDSSLIYNLDRMKIAIKQLNRLFDFTHTVPFGATKIPFHDSELITYSDER
jgi:hypothetical protein